MLHTTDTSVMSHLREVVPVVFMRNEVFEQMARKLDLLVSGLVSLSLSHATALEFA